MLVKDLMSVFVSSVKPDSSISEVIRIMRSENVGIVPVCDIQNHLLGVITDRDIIMRESDGKTVGDIMTKNIVTVSPKDDIHDAACKLSKFGIRRLPVIENQKLVGMLSLKDIASKKIYIAEIGHIIYDISKQK